MLELGPGDGEVRQRLYNMAKTSGAPFSVRAPLGKAWNKLYLSTWLTKEDLAEKDLGEPFSRAREQWQLFRHEVLPYIDAALGKESWFWEERNPEE